MSHKNSNFLTLLVERQNFSYNDPIESLGLPDNITEILKKKNISNLYKFTRLKRKRMLKFKGIGKRNSGLLMSARRIVNNKINGIAEKPVPDNTFVSTFFGQPDIPNMLSGDDPIDVLNIPTRVENCLKLNGIETIRDLINCPYKDIYKFRNIGAKSVEYLKFVKNGIKVNPATMSQSSNRTINTDSKTKKMIHKEEVIPANTLIGILIERSGGDRAMRIIKARYGLQTGGKETLEEIGHWFGITRERVRQIEAKTLKRMKHPSTRGRNLIISLINDTLSKNGLVINDEEADSLIPNIFDSEYDGSSFLDLLSDLGWIQRNKIGDISFYAPKATLPINLGVLMDKVYKEIQNSEELIKVGDLSDNLRKVSDEYKNYYNLNNLISRICKIDPRIEEKLPGLFGLYLKHPGTKDWRRQISSILQGVDVPLHFTEISDRLNEQLALTGDRRLDVRRVHSILIESPEFSHTGVKGTYGLTEWGFRKETTSELVEECIKKAGFPLYWKQIYNYVSKYKDTKPTNIMAILHTQNKFIKIGRGTFDVRK